MVNNGNIKKNVYDKLVIRLLKYSMIHPGKFLRRRLKRLTTRHPILVEFSKKDLLHAKVV